MARPEQAGIRLETFFSSDGPLGQALPGYEQRPQQIQMMEAVAGTLEEESRLIVEAGTGTGKTLAYLVPALSSGKRVVVSTGTKNLQEQIFYKDIRLLKKHWGGRFKAAILKGKNNYLCLYRFRQFCTNPLFEQPEETAFYGPILEWARKTATGDRAELKDLPENLQVWQELSVGEGCLGSACPDYNPCFITRLRQEAAAADLIVVNHHLFFADLVLKGNAYGEILPRYHAVIFDEAHKIEEIAAHHFGLRVSNYRLEELVRDGHRELKGLSSLGKPLDETYRQEGERFLQAVSRDSDRFFTGLRHIRPSVSKSSEESAPEGGAKIRLYPETLTADHQERFERIAESLTLLSRHFEKAEGLTEGMGSITRRAREILGEMTSLVQMDLPDWVAWIECRGRGVFLNASPLDLTDALKEHLIDQTQTLVFTSATLSVNQSLDYFKTRHGMTDAGGLILDSPFDYASQALLYLPARSHDPNTPDYVDFLTREVMDILSATGGRAFVLFTSYKNLELVYERCRKKLDFPLLRQGERPRSAILREFQEDIPSVLFATSSFWEGVDVPGESLSCVIIDRLPFASPKDPLVEARIQHLKQQGKDPFYDYQVPEAILTLKQGLGRLIRSRSDRGIMAILDGRIRSRRYGKLFLNSLPPCPVTSEIRDIRRFLQNAPPP